MSLDGIVNSLLHLTWISFRVCVGSLRKKCAANRGSISQAAYADKSESLLFFYQLNAIVPSDFDYISQLQPLRLAFY